MAYLPHSSVLDVHVRLLHSIVVHDVTALDVQPILRTLPEENGRGRTLSLLTSFANFIEIPQTTPREPDYAMGD